MNISICITVLNEEVSISELLDSLLAQSKKADEIVIVDGGSTDKTVEIIRHYQKKYSHIKLIVEKSSRAKARNIAVDIAKGEIILMTDAGCIANKNWIENIIKPFTTGKIDVVAGFYKMTGESKMQKAISVFMGVTPRKFNLSFLPSTRSIAFTKEIWEEVGGFPEKAKGTAEDTIFNLRLLKNGARISRMKNATVEWGMPTSIPDFYFKIMNYAKGDSATKNLIFPGKGLMSHNIKALSIYTRYLIFSTLLIFGLKSPIFLAYLILLFLIYLFWSYRKIYLEFGDWKISFWGPVLQIVSDFAVMRGFVSGIMKK